MVEVWLIARYTGWGGERKSASVEAYLPLTKVEPLLMYQVEQWEVLYRSLYRNYTNLLWEYKWLNSSHSTLLRSYAQLRSEYETLKREREAYTALAVAALLAAAGVAAYGWLKVVRAGKAQQRAAKPAAREAGGS